MKKGEERLSGRATQRLVYLLTVMVSVIFLYAGNRLAAAGGGELPPLRGGQERARVVEVLEDTRTELPGMEGSSPVSLRQIRFTARLQGGGQGDSLVIALQVIDEYTGFSMKPVAAGDRVTLYPNPDPATSLLAPYAVGDYLRSDLALWFCLLFLALLPLFGRGKGLRAAVALAFTCGAVFAVFLPLVLGGYSVYLSAVAVCVFCTLNTLLLINGAGKKTLAAAAGCCGGVLAAGLIWLLMGRLLQLTGLTSQDAAYLAGLPTRNPIDLKGVLFAAVVIGAVGAVMDVALSLASALWELRCQAAAPSFGMLMKSGMNIGGDMIGSMSNTLVLAYIGSALSTVLVLLAYTSSVEVLLNRERIVVEILQAVVGSMGILTAIPLTSAAAAFLYMRGGPKAAEGGPKPGPQEDPQG